MNNIDLTSLESKNSAINIIAGVKFSAGEIMVHLDENKNRQSGIT